LQNYEFHSSVFLLDTLFFCSSDKESYVSTLSSYIESGVV
jgi:hypothetical protein